MAKKVPAVKKPCLSPKCEAGYETCRNCVDHRKNVANRPAAKKDPLKPSALLMIKIGSLAIHADEIVETHGANLDFDGPAVKSIIEDPEVKEWIASMGVMLPRKRSTR